MARMGGVYQHRDSGKPRHRLFEKLQLLADHLDGEGGHAGDVSAGPRQAGHEPAPERIAMIRHDDGDGGRRPFGRAGRICCRHDHVDLELSQLGREGRESFGSPLRVPPLDDEILSLAITQLPQLLEQSAPDTRGSGLAQRDSSEKAESVHRCRRLSVDVERPGQKQKDTRDHPGQSRSHHGLSFVTGRSAARVTQLAPSTHRMSSEAAIAALMVSSIA